MRAPFVAAAAWIGVGCMAEPVQETGETLLTVPAADSSVPGVTRWALGTRTDEHGPILESLGLDDSGETAAVLSARPTDGGAVELQLSIAGQSGRMALGGDAEILSSEIPPTPEMLALARAVESAFSGRAAPDCPACAGQWVPGPAGVEAAITIGSCGGSLVGGLLCSLGSGPGDCDPMLEWLVSRCVEGTTFGLSPYWKRHSEPISTPHPYDRATAPVDLSCPEGTQSIAIIFSKVQLRGDDALVVSPYGVATAGQDPAALYPGRRLVGGGPAGRRITSPIAGRRVQIRIEPVTGVPASSEAAYGFDVETVACSSRPPS